MNEITQALQNVVSKRSLNTAQRYQSNWLVTNTNVYTDQVEKLLDFAKSLNLVAIEKLNSRTGDKYYTIEKNGLYVGLVSQPEYSDEKELCPDSWLLILNKEAH